MSSFWSCSVSVSSVNPRLSADARSNAMFSADSQNSSIIGQAHVPTISQNILESCIH